MLTLRLRRAGTKKRPVYHLIAADSRSRRDGRFVENLGYFIPAKDVLVLKQDRISYWLGVGAETSEVARHLIKKSKKQPAVVAAPAVKPGRARARAGKGGELASSKPQGSEGDGQPRAGEAQGS